MSGRVPQQSILLATITDPAFSLGLPSDSCDDSLSRLTRARADRLEHFGDRHLYGYVAQILEERAPLLEPSFVANAYRTMTSNATFSALSMQGGFLPADASLVQKEQADVFEALVGIAHQTHRKCNTLPLMEAWAKETFVPLLHALESNHSTIVPTSTKRGNDATTGSDARNPKRRKYNGTRPSNESSVSNKENIPELPMVSRQDRPSSTQGSRHSHSSTPQAESSRMGEHASRFNLTQASTQSIHSFEMTYMQGRVIAPLPRTSMTMNKRQMGDPHNVSVLELKTDRKSMPLLAPSTPTAPRSWKASADSPRSEQVPSRSLSSILPGPPKHLPECPKATVSQDRIIAPLPRSSTMRPRQELSSTSMDFKTPRRSGNISGNSAPLPTTSSNTKGEPKQDIPRGPRMHQKPSRLQSSQSLPMSLVPHRSSGPSTGSAPASDGPKKTLIALDSPRLRKSYAASGLFRRSTLGVLSQAANGDRNSRRQ